MDKSIYVIDRKTFYITFWLSGHLWSISRIPQSHSNRHSQVSYQSFWQASRSTHRELVLFCSSSRWIGFCSARNLVLPQTLGDGNTSESCQNNQVGCWLARRSISLLSVIRSFGASYPHRFLTMEGNPWGSTQACCLLTRGHLFYLAPNLLLHSGCSIWWCQSWNYASCWCCALLCKG